MVLGIEFSIALSAEKDVLFLLSRFCSPEPTSADITDETLRSFRRSRITLGGGGSVDEDEDDDVFMGEVVPSGCTIAAPRNFPADSRARSEDGIFENADELEKDDIGMFIEEPIER